MTEKKSPVKIILQRHNDIVKNRPMGGNKYFEPLTHELQKNISEKFENLLKYYDDVFKENSNIPAVGKITMKKEAIAKSYKPNDLCKNCEIIGGEELNELYIKLTEKNIKKTVTLIKKLPNKKIGANLTAISDISPITSEEKISSNLKEIAKNKRFDQVKNRIKIKLFDFGNEYDNALIKKYVINKLKNNLKDIDIVEYNFGENLEYFSFPVNSYEKIIEIANINGIKSIDYSNEFSLPENFTSEKNLDLDKIIENEQFQTSEVIIGIIDGGISKNKYLKDYIYDTVTYVPKEYIDLSHGTFIASTIQYGNLLNGIKEKIPKRFKFLDVIAIPNSNEKKGKVDYISEEDLMTIIEEVVEKYHNVVKIWNLSLGTDEYIDINKMSDLAIFLDYIQDKYKVQFFIAAGNITNPLRKWPVETDLGEKDRIKTPGDSVRGITVGSIAYYDSEKSLSKKDCPSPFSRRGPGINYIVKPEVVDYGGNLEEISNNNDLGMFALGINGNLVKGIGTSYATPRIVKKFASIYDELHEKDLLVAKGMLIHSARLETKDKLKSNPNNIKYYGFGTPSIDCTDILSCNDEEITLLFKQKVQTGYHLELINFPYPNLLIEKNKYFGEITMTLVHNGILDPKYGKEYCRTNIDASFGAYNISDGRIINYAGEVPLEKKWDDKYETNQIENGFKWNPIKSYYRNLVKGINQKDGWKIRIDTLSRNGTIVPEQEFVFIITIRGKKGMDIYSDVVNGLRENGYVTNNLKVKQQIRQ